MTRRKVTTLDTTAPLPLGVDPTMTACEIDGLLQTTGVLGVELTSGELGGSPEHQFQLAFQNLVTLLERAGFSKDHVGLVTVYIPDSSYRQYINAPWLATFPADGDRPARKTNHVNLPAGVFVQIQAVAVRGARREAIEIPGLAHRDPLPMGCRMGDMLFSSVISPEDPADGKRVNDPLAQIQLCFDNVGLLLEQAGGSLDQVAHMWVFLSDFEYQSAMVDAWVQTWKEDGKRPSRKTLRYPLGGQTLMQVQVTGVLSGERTNHEIPGVHHHDPIPMGTLIGKRFYSSGVSPSDPEGDGLTAVEGLEAQIAQCETNIGSMMISAGGSLDDILHTTVTIKDFETIPLIMNSWSKLFPDPSDRPSLKFIDWRISGSSHVQYHVVAVMGTEAT